MDSPSRRHRPLSARAIAAFAAVLGIIGVTAAAPAEACTRILWNDNGRAVLSTRSMDWEPESSEPELVITPRGTARVGNVAGSQRISDPNPLRWKARYGSVAVTAMGSGTADGMNEKGLVAHALWLNGADFGTRDPERPALQDGLWAQYFLDRAATVKEAVALVSTFQVVPLVLSGDLVVPVSIALEDATGDSAILQYVGGALQVFHGPEHRVLANDPPYEQARTLIDPAGYSESTRNDPLPGNTNSRDRFVRANYYLDFLRRTKPASLAEAKASLMSVARNVSDPIGAPMDTPGSRDETDYRTLSDLTNRTYSFEPTRRLALLTTDLRKIDFSAGQPVRTLDPTMAGLNGDVTNRYRPLTSRR